MYFNDWLSRRRLYTPERVAVVDDADARRFTYRELDERATCVARFLQGTLSIQPGERVACLSTNRVEYLDLYFACGKMGAVLVPVNHRFPAAEIAELLQDCQPRVLIYEASFAEVVHTLKREGVVREILPIEANESDPAIGTLAESAAGHCHATSDFHPFQASQDDIAMILYTSGTTGRAKGAMISYRQIHWNALNTTIGLQLTEADVSFLNMPLYHTGGWHVLFTPLMQLGGRVILQQRFDAERCNTLLGAEGVTILFGVPTMLRMMREAQNFATADLSSVRYAIFGGEPCPLPIIEAFQGRGVAMRQGYGLTEAGPNCFSLPAEDAVRRKGSIGFPNFFVAAKLVTDDGRQAAIHEVGELWMHGPHVFAGYWGNRQATAEVLRHGWLATGDLMTQDAQGYYYVVGRKKEMYVSGGENVYPAQVERVLQGHTAVALAAVLGVPDAKWGETGWAFVQLRPDHAATEAELSAWCRQHLATFQCPSRFLVLEELPLGVSGKIDKLLLAQRISDMITS